MFTRTYVPHYWPTGAAASLESLTTLTIDDDPAMSYARHLDIAADLPRLAPNLRVFHWHYGKQYNQERRMGGPTGFDQPGAQLMAEIFIG